MNKCVICTFFKMVWEGLWNDTCPSVDKKKEEKPLGFRRTIKEGIVIIPVGLITYFFMYLIYRLLLWILGAELFAMVVTIIALIALCLMVFSLFWGLIGFIKEKIACIKAYWRKAKEECE